MSRYAIGEVAQLAHVSVRTLHHYDEIGLLVPSGRSTAGYRLYSDDDLARLRQILFYRTVEFGLDDIAAMLAEPGTTTADHLRRQHKLLREQIDHRRDLLAALEKELEARDMGISLTPQEQFEIFGDNWPSDEYTTEAKEQWGHTDAWAQSQSRSTAFSKDDWLEIKAETYANEAAFAAALRDGVPADSDRAAELAEAHRAGISRFWDCSRAAHACLGETYVGDPRFSEHYDDIAPGLAQYVRDAIVANATR